MKTSASISPDTAAVPSTPGVTPHIAALDGIRGVAILMVMLFHFHLPWEVNGWPGRLWDVVSALGTNGVNLFFVLSGFLITGILWDAKGDPHYLRNFYARRVLRIFPLYYGALLVGLVLVPLLHPVSDLKYNLTVQHQVWLWTYLSNFYESWTGRALPLFGHFWSLAVEEQFYLVWPFVVIWAGRRALMGICAGCFVAAFVVRLGLLYAGADPGTAVLRLAPCQLDCLATGGFLALLLRSPDPMRAASWRAAMPRIFAASAVVTAAMVFVLPGLVESLHLSLALFNSCWSIFFGSGLFLTVVGSAGLPLRQLLETAGLRAIGKYSYGLYVFHWPIGRLWLGVMEKWHGEHPGSWLAHSAVFQAGYFVVAAGTSLLAAWLSWHLYEKHFLRLKRHFAYRRRPPVPFTASVAGGAY